MKNVDYQRIFGQKEKNYGDYDIVFYVADKKELFLIESKYFSDSLNSSGLVNDYNKMFGKGGYYTHCRERYDLIMKEPEKIKSFINETDDISDVYKRQVLQRSRLCVPETPVSRSVWIWMWRYPA